jgi:pimeloyl-ACP methyl ester carboxylesterase
MRRRAGRRKIAACRRDVFRGRRRFTERGNSMNRPVSAALPGARLSRRTAIGRLAGAGAVAVIATTHIGISHGAAQPLRSSIVTTQEGITMSMASPTANNSPLTVVLVDGAFADASGWAGVIAALAGNGLTVVAPPNPLRGVSADSAYIASFLQQIKGPVLLVGHSYGGVVITNAASRVDNVVGLVYVDGFLPDDGETLQALSAQATDSLIGPALRPAQYPNGNDAKPGTEFLIDPASFHSVFCADVPDAEAMVMAITQRPLSGLAFSEPTQNPAWKKHPSWSIIGSADKVIGVIGLRFMSKRANSATVELDGASHVSMISQPQAVADVIANAIKALA